MLNIIYRLVAHQWHFPLSVNPCYKTWSEVSCGHSWYAERACIECTTTAVGRGREEEAIKKIKKKRDIIVVCWKWSRWCYNI